ncbi:unnamed protein product [Tetraodon nigroviridis]|uniref:(spotted green pufferfish) hypothetical protein n=1 Tax=Tetraodon nigroviridis TaxID=99883 RepID=Q4S662_TETNG|nr:unnamed protein product [Tetraodon nigroviridis]
MEANNGHAECVFAHRAQDSHPARMQQPLTLDTAPLWQTRQGSPGSSWAGWLLGGETLPQASAIIYPKSAASRHVAPDRELQYFISLPVNQPCVGADGNIV